MPTVDDRDLDLMYHTNSPWQHEAAAGLALLPPSVPQTGHSNHGLQRQAKAGSSRVRFYQGSSKRAGEDFCLQVVQAVLSEMEHQIRQMKSRSANVHHPDEGPTVFAITSPELVGFIARYRSRLNESSATQLTVCIGKSESHLSSAAVSARRVQGHSCWSGNYDMNSHLFPLASRLSCKVPT